MAKKRFEVDVPDGQHLGHSKDSGGAYRGLMFDDKTNELVGHAELREVRDRAKKRGRSAASNEPEDAASPQAGRAERHDVEEPDSLPNCDYVTNDSEPSTGWGEVLGAAVLLGVAVAAAKGLQHVHNRDEDGRSAQARRRSKRKARAEVSSARAGLPSTPSVASAGWYVDPYDGRCLRYWDGQAWTSHVVMNPDVGHLAPPALAPAQHAAVVQREPTVSMSIAEWQHRLRAMLLARAFSEDQLRLLSQARIEDASPALLDLQRALAQLTPHEISHRIQLMLEANPAALTEAEAEFLRIFGGIRTAAGQTSWAAAPVIEYAKGAVERGGPARAPAGWYGDGHGRQRWWDGQRWTSHMRATPYTRPAGLGVPPGAGWYDDGSGRKRWWDGQRWR